MKALILAAGYGTRLYPYTKNLPKPLLKIDKRPIIDYLLDKLSRLRNISKIIVVTNARFFKQFQAWGNGSDVSQRVFILNDLTKSPEDKLGAVGDIDFALRTEGLGDDFLVLGGDNLFKGELGDFIHFAKTKTPYVTIGLFDVKDKAEARNFGVVSINRQKRIVDFKEKPTCPKSSLVSMCLYYFPCASLRSIKEYLNDPQNSCDAPGAYINWLAKKNKVYGFVFKRFWFDVGHFHTYKKINEILKEKR